MYLALKCIGAQCACPGPAHNRVPLFHWGQQNPGSEKDASGLNGARASGFGEVVSLQEKLQNEQRCCTCCPDVPSGRHLNKRPPWMVRMVCVHSWVSWGWDLGTSVTRMASSHLSSAWDELSPYGVVLPCACVLAGGGWCSESSLLSLGLGGAAASPLPSGCCSPTEAGGTSDSGSCWEDSWIRQLDE